MEHVILRYKSNLLPCFIELGRCTFVPSIRADFSFVETKISL